MPACHSAQTAAPHPAQCELESYDSCNACAPPPAPTPARDVKLQKAMDSWRKAMQQARPMRSGYTN